MPVQSVRPSRPVRRALAGAVAALAVSGLVVTAPPAEAVTSGKYEKDVAKFTNAERAKKDRVKLKPSSCVDRFAERQARRMADSGALVHQDLGPILAKCKLKAVGENIAMGYPSGKSVTAAWMKSPGHRKNILRKGYRLYGVGAVKDEDGTWWVSHVFGRLA